MFYFLTYFSWQSYAFYVMPVMPYAVCLSCEGQKRSKHDKFYFIENIFNLLVVINNL